MDNSEVKVNYVNGNITGNVGKLKQFIINQTRQITNEIIPNIEFSNK